MAISTPNPWDVPGTADSKLRFVAEMLREGYPDLDIIVHTNMPGDYVEFSFRRRGVELVRNWRLANTFLAVASPSRLVQEFENVIAGWAEQPKQPAKEERMTTTHDSWADEWIKKNVKR